MKKRVFALFLVGFLISLIPFSTAQIENFTQNITSQGILGLFFNINYLIILSIIITVFLFFILYKGLYLLSIFEKKLVRLITSLIIVLVLYISQITNKISLYMTNISQALITAEENQIIIFLVSSLIALIIFLIVITIINLSIKAINREKRS